MLYEKWKNFKIKLYEKLFSFGKYCVYKFKFPKLHEFPICSQMSF